MCPGHGEHDGLPERLRGRMSLWAAGDGTGGRGSNRGSVAAGTAEELPVPEQTKRAEPPTRQQAAPVKTARRERPREEKWRYQAGLAIRRQGRVDMARSLMAAGMEMDKAIRAAGYASRNAYHRAAKKTDEEREQHGHETYFAGAGSGAGNG